ncbi:MAG: RpiB/LacA/LacB family sugar-phosphate isomerase [Candidatus Neomarinimicrobiota bacterium]|nr:RpiB/LacA/LacB family sugar-phosphate isomerase [Candidatus Neomarinimicrobiota bacterium]
MKIHLATDHAGLDLKNAIGDYLKRNGYEVVDYGAHKYDAEDDYPDFIFPCAEAVAADYESRGIILGGSGQGEAMAANRVRGVRAAVYYGSESEIPRLSREHNNANILSLGARFISEAEIYSVIDIWLAAPFVGGRHQRRIEKLDR